ncbi:MAG: pre-peptidase C-terminal domain-containing protein, partial [Planctomycetales bacterium]|nr:pre-peptidase C-terminal domain-containing protein [Planctomycetales bacterium]
MSFRRFGTRVRNIAERRHDRQRTQKRLQTRQNLVQQLEDRRMLAGPELVAIRPDARALLNDGDTLNIAPLEFNLQFRAGANLDEATIDSQSIKLVRSGGDGTFGDGNEVDVALGYVGLENPGFTDPANLQRIVFRTASSASHNATEPSYSFPDDTYQIQIYGSGPNTLTNLSGEAFNGGVDLFATFRLDRGAQVVAVVPQPISHSPLSQASDEIEVYFDDQPLDPTQVVNPAYYRLVNTAASLTTADDSTLLPETVTYDSAANKVTLKFASAIPEGTFRLDVGQSGGDNSVLSGAIRIGSLNNSNHFSQNGFLGDLGGTSNNAADVDLYNVLLAAGSTLQATVVPHASGLNLRVRLLDAGGAELFNVNSGADATNVLNFPITTAAEYFIEITSADGTTGSYALDAGVIGSPISTDDNNSTFATGTDLGTLGAADVLLTSSIRRQPIPIPPLPGSEDEPGHRDIQREAHIGASGTTPTVPAPVRVIHYYFPDTLGTDTNGDTYPNLITAKEKQIVREIFEIYAQLSGYEFIESSVTVPGGDDLMIGKGDFRAVSPTLGPNDGVAGLANGSFAMVNGSIYNQSNRFFGDGFTSVMFHEIGHSLGLGHSYDIPSNQGSGVPNDVLPGDHDVVHLQRIVPPNSTDIDMYNFTLSERGRLTAETIAERLSTPSLLNTSISLYRQVNGVWELVARNDQYYGADSFLDLQLDAGTYSIGVSSTGNTSYDPRVPDSGFGGTTDGAYDLKLSFQADQDGTMLDATGTPFDGDADGRPGGLYSFWFQSTDPASTIYVDKSTDTTAGPEGSGTLADPYDTIEFALQKAGDRIVVPVDGHNSISVGEGFVIDDGINVATFRFGTAGLNPVDLTGATSPADVALAIQTAVNNAIAGGRLIGSVTVNVSNRIVQFSGIDNLNIAASPTLLATPNLVRILANGGQDQDISTASDNRPYLVGLDTSGNPLADGAEFLVPQGVNVMIEAGALLKMRRANLDAGSSSANISRSQSSIQVLGTPELSVLFRSYHDDTVGGDSDGVGPATSSGDFGGIVFRGDSDLDSDGIYLNYVNHADINNGGGDVFVDANELPFAPIYVTDARPTLSFNRITSAKGPAISASPDSFDDSLGRIGPDIDGNYLSDNEINGLFIRVKTPLGSTIDKLDVSGRFNDTDITHVLSENLIISGAAGGPLLTAGGTLVARAGGRLVVDPGLVLKLDLARIEVERGSGALIAEGTENRPVIFTSTADDRFGGSGEFNTDDTGNPLPLPGDWGGIYFGAATSGSIDNALIAYGGGTTPIEGGAAAFNAIEIHQADVRIANSVIDSNAGGGDGSQRNGRGANQNAAIYVRAAQPIIVDNTIINNRGPAININANAMRFETQRDTGRTTGPVDRYSQFDDNTGPLVRLNRLDDNSVNGMQVRGEYLTTETIWDDTDVVHVLAGEVVVGNLHTYNGLTLKSSNAESLVIKAASSGGGFTATGSPQEIIDRVGGTIHILGTPGHPVLLTSISDDSVGAGFTPSGDLSSNTNNSVNPTTGTPGDWRGLLFDEFSNDRNVLVVRELENPLTNGNDTNRNTVVAQNLGVLAPDEKSGDENRRLGFAVNGFISPTNADDVDVYSFIGTAGTEVWLDIDRTNTNLDAIIEVVNATGTVLARSVRSGTADPGNLNADTLTKNPLLGGDHYTQNFRDPGMRYVLPGTPGATGTYFVRVRSNPATAGNINVLAGESRGEYQLQIRLQQVQEFPGSIVKFADIRYAATGIDVRGLPAHSPLIGEAGELPAANDTFATAQTLVNLLETDVAALGISGNLASGTDADWYEFELTQTGVQLIAGVNDGAGTIAVVLDIDYSDKAVRADTTVAVFDENQNLVYFGGESNIIDDQPVGLTGSIDDLSRGSLGNKDAYIGPIHLTPGTEATPKRYYVAVMSDRQVPSALTGVFQAAPANSANGLVRLEPVNSVVRIIEDHLGFQGYSSRGGVIAPRTPTGLFDLSSTTAVDVNVQPFRLEDVALYVGTDRVEDNNNLGNNDHLYTVNPYQSSRWLTRVTNANGINGGVDDVQDIVIRTDGRMFGYQRLNGNASSVGALVELDPETGTIISAAPDNIAGQSPTPNAGSYATNIESAVSRDRRANQFTTSDEVDALTFRRTGVTGPASAPVPEYDVYYSVRESDNSSKLYLGRQDGDARLDPNDPYGFRGYIQPAGVTFTERLITVIQPVQNAPSNVTTIRLKSKIPGTAGDFSIDFLPRPNNTNAVVSVNGNIIELEIGGTGGPPITGAPSAAAIVDAINNHAVASQMVTAVVYGGNANTSGDGADGTPAIIFRESLVVAGDDGADGPLLGRVTGLSFGNFYGTGNLYGVTNAGEFLIINPNTGVVTQRIDTTNAIGIANLDFQGLALGPQNVEGGAYSNTLFAVTSSGQVVAFDTSGNGFYAFESGNAAQVVTTDSGVTGGFFTLTTDVGGFGRETTDPIAVDAPAVVSLNETQLVRSVGAGVGGTFTLSLVDDLAAVSSPTTVLDGIQNNFFVQDATDFPPAPFTIKVENEQMLVNSVTGDQFFVTRGVNGTAAAPHPDTSTVFEVRTSTTAGVIFPTPSSTLATAIDDVTTTVSVSSAAAFPTTTPFTIRIQNEEMVVTAVAGNDLTVLRGQNGTTAEYHLDTRLVRVLSDTITLLDPSPFPTAPGFNIRIGNEDMRVVGVAGNQFDVIRGANNTVVGFHSGGSTVYKLDTTAPIPFDATTTDIANALGALPSVGGAANVMVTGGQLTGQFISSPLTVEFVGALAAKNFQLMTGDSSKLVGDELQEIELDPIVTGGTFQLQFGGQSTTDLNWNATAAEVEAALRALAGNRPDFIVTGTNLAAGPLTVRFTGELQDQNVAALVAPAANENLLQNEIQSVTTSGGPTGGTFTLNINDPANGIINGATAAIQWNTNAAGIQAALETGIPELLGNISVTGTALPGGTVLIEFINAFAATDMATFSFTTALTGGTTPSIVVATTQTTDAPGPIITETRRGVPVSVPITASEDGVLSVRDSLLDLASFNLGDISAAGILSPPGNGVSVTFTGAYAGVNVPLMEADNFLNVLASEANVVSRSAPGAGTPGSFIMDVSGMNVGAANPIGLAFSPLDFNLWHPTTLRSNDAGHGINEADDDTRVPGAASVNYTTPGSSRTFNQGQGGVSYQFGFEQWVQNQTSGSQQYLTYLPGVNAQYGILNTDFHADLSSNSAIVGNFGNGVQGSYNLPAGALGTLTTGTFDLDGTVDADRPTLYFTYFLETEGHSGSNLSSDGGDPFRDSARVFISADGGATWNLVASNNSQLSAADPTSGPGTAELPGFLSRLSDAGLNSATPRAESQQIVQELFDNTGQWRQARVDLSTYAGLTGLMLRVDFSSAGSMNDSTLGRIDTEYDTANATDVAEFGEYVSTTGNARSIRSLDNQYQGFFVDDFIIGYAERGEMVTGDSGDSGITNLFAGGSRTQDNDPGQFPDIVNGPYQLEIRRTDEYVVLTSAGPVVGSIFDTNDRHIDSATETANLSFEPTTFVPSLVPVDTTILGGFTAAEIEPWSVTTNNPNTGVASLESGAVGANRVSIFEVRRSDLTTATDVAGVIRFSFDVSSALDRHGLRFFIDGVPQTLVSDSGETPVPDRTLASGVTGYQTVEFTFGLGDPVFTWAYDFTDAAPAGGDNRAFIDDVQILQGGTGLLADRNRDRAQGILVLDSNFVTNSAGFGINVQPGTTQAGGSVPHPGSTINFPQLNTQRLVPGVVIQNNVIAGSSGIRFAGETGANPQRPVPFGRLINNTLVGGDRTGTGIEVFGLASPTILNNLINDFNIGINNGGTGTVIRSNFFQDNAINGSIGTASIIAPNTAPLFLDSSIGNYYLVDTTTAINSSQNTEQDRLNYLTFKTELGIPASPINAPSRDVFGQLRVDPNASALGDRGAVEDTDADAPYATLLNPIDNDAEGNDRDPSDTVVMVTNTLLENFTILLGDGRDPNSPFEGTGVNGLTVDDPNDDSISDRAIKIEQNGVQLIQGVDYIVGYNELSGVLRLTPLGTLWEASSVYVISLDNGLIADRAGNLLRSNQTNGDTRFTIIIPDVGIDFGDAPDTYRTLLPSNGARHTINKTNNPTLGLSIDSEPDGQPSVGADGDNLTGGDEDGLTVGAFMGTTTTEGLFLTQGASDPTSDPNEVVAFL